VAAVRSTRPVLGAVHGDREMACSLRLSFSCRRIRNLETFWRPWLLAVLDRHTSWDSELVEACWRCYSEILN
jgi:hypothetical protein